MSCSLFIVLHRVPGGGELTAKIFDKNGVEVPPTEYDLDIDGDDFTFNFKRPSRDKSGKYTLVFGYDGKETSADIYVEFQDVPTPPLDLSVSEVFSTQCLLSWNPPSDDGGTLLTHYVVERQEVGAGQEWQEIGETAATITRFECLELVEKKKYKFRVKAVNKIGPSPPGELQEPVLAKDPWGPAGPPLDLQVEDWDATYVDLTWKPPVSDGGAEITRYLVECREKFSKEWVRCHITEDTTCKAKVEDVIKEGKTYEFRVKAINKSGEGEASEPCKPVLCKSRFVKPFLIGDVMEDLVVKKGKNLSWDLKFGGEPEPEVEWFFGEEKIEADDR